MLKNPTNRECQAKHNANTHILLLLVGLSVIPPRVCGNITVHCNCLTTTWSFAEHMAFNVTVTANTCLNFVSNCLKLCRYG